MKIINYSESTSPSHHAEFFCLDQNQFVYDLIMKLDFKSIAESEEVRNLSICNYYQNTENEITAIEVEITFEAKFDSSCIMVNKALDDCEDPISFCWCTNYPIVCEEKHREMLSKIQNEVIPELVEQLLKIEIPIKI